MVIKFSLIDCGGQLTSSSGFHPVRQEAQNVIYSGLCEGEKENGAGEKKMLAVVDFFLLFSLIPTFCQPQEIFFHWFLLLKLWIFFIPKKQKNFCIPREGTGIYSVPKVGLCCPSGNFLSWGATSQLKEPRRTKNFYSPARPKCQKNFQPPRRT